MARHKIHTIHHNGLAFFANRDHAYSQGNGFDFPYGPTIVYDGLINDMPRELAHKIAEVHDGFSKYYEYAMAVLYKTYTFKSGTEDPVLAISTKRSKKERDGDYQYVVIWNIFEE